MQKAQVRWKESLIKVENILEDVKTLLNFSQKDLEVLRIRKELLKSWADEIIEDFYSVLLKDEKAKEIIEKNKVSIERLKEANKAWYNKIVSGEIDEEFFKYSFFVGLVHIYYGVDNHLMIFMADVMRRKFLQLCLENFEEGEAFEVYQSFSKIVAAFVGLTVEGYVFMLKKALLDILGMKPELVNRLLKIELEKTLELFREKIKK